MTSSSLILYPADSALFVASDVRRLLRDLSTTARSGRSTGTTVGVLLAISLDVSGWRRAQLYLRNGARCRGSFRQRT